MRERAGLTVAAAAAVHSVDKTTISNTESARFGVSADRVRVWAANYSCPDRAYVDALADMTRERGTNWWDEYRGALSATNLDLAELEHHAVAIRAAQVMHMPGLLQHEDYVRALFEEAVPPLAADALEKRLAFRLGRSGVLDRQQSPECTFLIHESALRMQFGGRCVTRTQLHHLLKQCDREKVTVRVLPFAAGGFPNAGSSTFHAYGPVPQLDTMQTDVPGGAAFLHSETHLANCRMVLDRMEQRCLSPTRSRDFISEVTRQL